MSLALVGALALASHREYGIFTALQYYGPPLSEHTYERVAKASRVVPMYVVRAGGRRRPPPAARLLAGPTGRLPAPRAVRVRRP